MQEWSHLHQGWCHPPHLCWIPPLFVLSVNRSVWPDRYNARMAPPASRFMSPSTPVLNTTAVCVVCQQMCLTSGILQIWHHLCQGLCQPSASVLNTTAVCVVCQQMCVTWQRYTAKMVPPASRIVPTLAYVLITTLAHAVIPELVSRFLQACVLSASVCGYIPGVLIL